MCAALRLPIGIDSFEKIRSNGSYYIDKTRFIEELLNDSFEVMLFTRPRRFGKTLMLQTLESFFGIGKEGRQLFEGLYISEKTELCDEWMNNYPVISVSFKDIEGSCFDDAYGMLCSVTARMYMKHSEAFESLSVNERDYYGRIVSEKASERDIKNSLYVLSSALYRYYGKRVIVLIDEYDVPLAKADENGYYDRMLGIVRSIFSQALKGNDTLMFAVVTGCLRVARESIFTGANNFKTNTVYDDKYSGYFGFTREEVGKLLADAGLYGEQERIKRWYDGYRFGNTEIYCPWDVINCVGDLSEDPSRELKNYWKNTSHNSIIRRFVDRSDLFVNEKFESLLNGGYVRTEICDDLTYDVMHSSEENLWTILYMTGYLTMAAEQSREDGVKVLNLVIPNEEIKLIFKETVVKWFRDRIITVDRSSLFKAFREGDAETVSDIVSDLLFDTISYHDYKESYYHAFLTGIFTGAGYAVESNFESGLGRPDIVVKDNPSRTVIIIEVKYTKNARELHAEAEAALEQISARKYTEGFKRLYRNILVYGAAFCGKECLFLTDRDR